MPRSLSGLKTGDFDTLEVSGDFQHTGSTPAGFSGLACTGLVQFSGDGALEEKVTFTTSGGSLVYDGSASINGNFGLRRAGPETSFSSYMPLASIGGSRTFWIADLNNLRASPKNSTSDCRASASARPHRHLAEAGGGRGGARGAGVPGGLCACGRHGCCGFLTVRCTRKAWPSIHQSSTPRPLAKPRVDST